MSNRDPRTIQRIQLAIAVAVLLALAGTFAARDSWSTAAGVLCGGGLSLGLLVWASRRAEKRGADAATAERIVSGRGDERDNRVYLATMSIVGIVAFLVTALAPVAVELGLDPDTALGALPYVLITTAVVAYLLIDRRT